MEVVFHEVVVSVNMGHDHHLDRERIGIHQIGPRGVGVEDQLVRNAESMLILGLFPLIIPAEGPVGEVDGKAVGQNLQHLLGRDGVKLLRKEIEAKLPGDFLNSLIEFTETLKFWIHGHLSKWPVFF